MRLTRRALLQGIALGGLATPLFAGASPGAGPRSTPQALDTCVLVPPGQSDTAFVHGARAALGTRPLLVWETPCELEVLRTVDALLRRGQPLRMVGLLDDATATPLLDVARTAGVSMAWLGQHSVTPHGVDHRVQACAQAQSCALRFADSSPADGGQWAADLGHRLCAMDAPPTRHAPRRGSHATPLHGRFVSFLMQV